MQRPKPSQDRRQEFKSQVKQSRANQKEVVVEEEDFTVQVPPSSSPKPSQDRRQEFKSQAKQSRASQKEVVVEEEDFTVQVPPVQEVKQLPKNPRKGIMKRRGERDEAGTSKRVHFDVHSRLGDKVKAVEKAPG